MMMMIMMMIILFAPSLQARKVGSELAEADAAELERVTKETSVLQKQLDQVRKQQRQHQMVINDYRMKQQVKMPVHLQHIVAAVSVFSHFFLLVPPCHPSSPETREGGGLDMSWCGSEPSSITKVDLDVMAQHQPQPQSSSTVNFELDAIELNFQIKSADKRNFQCFPCTLLSLTIHLP